MAIITRKSQDIWRVIDLIKWGEQYFLDNKFENPRKEIELLIQEILNCTRVDLYLRFEEPLTKPQLETLRDWVRRRKNREPSQYITGKAGFYNLILNVTPDVLIPRPESEILVDTFIEVAGKRENLSILDIGTGSGCLALAIANELSSAKITGIDNSVKAIELAQLNSDALKIENVEFKLLDILTDKIENKFDIIISNPPYILKSEMENLMEDVTKFEPHSALTDFNDGLTFYRKFVDISTKILNPNGWFIVEVGLGKHPQKVLEMFSNDKFINVELVKDLNGDNRVLKAQLA